MEIEAPFFETQKKEIVLKAQQVHFSNEILGPIIQYVDVSSKSERYSIETQLTDLLDELLSTIPNKDRTNKVLNNVHIIIERFQQLRETYSTFDEYGNVIGPLKYKADYKPLSKYFNDFKTNLFWILPVVKNIKKLYFLEDDKTEDISNDINIDIIRVENDLTNLENIIHKFKISNLRKQENKYNDLIENINSFFTPFVMIDIENQSDIIIDKTVNTDITVINVNDNNLYSYALEYEGVVHQKRFSIQKYNSGLNNIESKNYSLNKQKSLTESDTMTIQSFITLPEPIIRFSKVNLPGTDILNKAVLSGTFINYWQLLKNNTNIESVILNDEYILNETNFVNNIKNYMFNLQTNEMNNSTNQQIYDLFIDKLVPKTRILFNLMKKYIHGKFSIVDVVDYLEPFLIYTHNLTYMQYVEIIHFINDKISEYNKNYIEKYVNFHI